MPPTKKKVTKSSEQPRIDKLLYADVQSEIEETATDVDIDEFAKKMGLEVLNRGSNTTVRFSTFNISRPGLQLAGYYTHFAPERIQMLGEMEWTYLDQLSDEARKKACDEYMKQPIPCLISTTKNPPCDELLSAAKEYDRVVFWTQHRRTTGFMNKLSIYLNELLAPALTVHSGLMDIYGMGVLIMGEPGIGKSETALALIERGHRLVADDAVTIKRVGDKLEGSCPDVIRHLMEIRGIGIIDVKALYGAGAIKESTSIDMVVRLEEWDPKKQYDRLGSHEQKYNVLGVEKPLYTIPVKPGRSLAIILETAARMRRLNDLGFSAVDELNERLKGKLYSK